jgi:site-specific DNA recombinase
MHIRVGLYARYSDAKQDDGYSIEYQLSECQEYLNKQGLSLSKTYIDQAITGTKVAGREAFHELIHDVKNELIDVVVVYKFNRIFRNAYESHKYRKLFKKHNVRLISITQLMDDETSAGRLMINVLADIDQFQSETISDFVKSSMREMAKQGYFTGGTVPYGYKLETVFDNGKKKKKRYVPDEYEKEVVKKLFELYADNYSLKYLQGYTRSVGAVTRQGKTFGITSISRMLRNDFYVGVLRYNAQGHEPIVVYDVIPPIIDKVLWERVQRRHESQKDVKPRKRKDLYSLTGKIICGKCGKHFFGIRSGSVQRGKRYDYKYYVCSTSKTYSECSCKRIRKDILEDIVLKEIKKHILNEKAIYQIANGILVQIGKNPGEQRNRLKQLKKELTTVKSQISELLELRSLKLVDNAYVAEHMAPHQQRAKELEIEIQSIEQQTKTTLTHTMIVDYLKKMLTVSDTTDDEVLQTIFNNFVDKIIIDDEAIEVRLFVNPPSAEFAYKNSYGHPKWSLYTTIKREAK